MVALSVWWWGSVPRRPAPSTAKLRSSRLASSAGVIAARRAAARSIASAIPSSRRTAAATGAAFSAVTANSGLTAAARSANSRTASAWVIAVRSASAPGTASGGTGTSRSPQSPAPRGWSPRSPAAHMTAARPRPARPLLPAVAHSYPAPAAAVCRVGTPPRRRGCSGRPGRSPRAPRPPHHPVHPLPAIALTMWPIAIGVAILRYRLYDIDLLITRTVVYGLLTALVTAVYLAIVVGIGTLVGSRGEPNLLLSIVATALIAVAFQPARERSRRLANRLVYGKRATPYEVLSAFSQAMAGASTDDSLLRMARLVVEATGAVKATVWLRLGEVLQAQASWPQAGPLPQPIALEGRGVQEALAVAQATSVSFPVGYEEELLGALTVTASRAEPLTPASEKLIADLAAQTGLGLRFQRLKERALFARALASFLPPEVAELVEASPSALSLREELEATILFSDIRGFSSLAERLPPRQVAEVVGRHLAAMVELVTSHGGVLDKFAGDAVMAVFGAPRPADDHARRALGCAAAMQRRQAALNDEAARAAWQRSRSGSGSTPGR